MTWEQLAEKIARMSAKHRKYPVMVADESGTEWHGKLNVDPRFGPALIPDPDAKEQELD